MGLAAYLTGLDWIALNALDGDNLVNEGKLAEQFVGQHLLQPLEPPRLTYWLREQKTANAETDYVTSSGNLVVPIEVKAGKTGTLKSLHQFAARKKSPLCVRFDLNLPEICFLTHSVRMDGGSIPEGGFYMTNLTVSISDDRFLKLKEVAGQLRVTPEELVVAIVPVI